MIATKIAANEAGQRFDKYLKKLLKDAPDSFIYKMLRKKNIVLNGKKADGREKLCLDDEVQFFLAGETFEKFCGNSQNSQMDQNCIRGQSDSGSQQALRNLIAKVKTRRMQCQ